MRYVVRSGSGSMLARSRSLEQAHRATRKSSRIGSSVDLNMLTGDAEKFHEIAGYVEKYLAILEASHLARPRIELRGNLGSRWLGRDVWWPVEPETTTLLIQRRVLGDARTLERVVAHEMVHHVDSVLHGAEQLRLPRFARPDPHGKVFLDLAEKINAVMGPCFVTVKSDAEFIEDAVCKTYLLVIVPNASGTRYGYSWAARPSRQQLAELERLSEKYGALGIYVTDPRWAGRGARLKRFGSVSVPATEEDQARLRELHASVGRRIQERRAG